MRCIVFDTGPLISLSLNNLLWLLPRLKAKYGGRFFITPGVKRESVDEPLKSKKYKFEAFQILKLIDEGVLEVFRHPEQDSMTEELLATANSMFLAHDHYIKNVHYAELEVIASGKLLEAEFVVIDEFITRMLVEDPHKVKDRMERKMHLTIGTNQKNLEKFKSSVKGLKVIRSMELVTIAFELGLLDDFTKVPVKNSRKELLEALLWGVKLNGCSGMVKEIDEILKLEGF